MSDETALRDIARDIKTILGLVSKAVNAISEAESEIPERMRRFVMYWHDLHDIVNVFEERGHQAPEYVMREMERCDDRFRQILNQLHTDGGTFEKVRREMAKDPENRWDHTRLLTNQKVQNETRQSTDDDGWLDKG